MARPAIIPRSPPKRTTRTTRKGTITTTTSSSSTRRANEGSATEGSGVAAKTTRGRTTRTQGSATAGIKKRTPVSAESKTRTTRSRSSKKTDVELDDDEGTDDEIGLISTRAKSSRTKASSSSSTSSSSKGTTGRGTRGATTATAAATSAAVADSDNDDDELAQSDAPKKKQVGRPRTKKPSPKDSAVTNSDSSAKPVRGRPRAAATKPAATEEPEKGVATRKKARVQTSTTSTTSSVETTNPSQIVVTANSSAAVKSNLLRGPAKKKKVTFQDVSDSEKENTVPEPTAVGRRRAATTSSTSTRQAGLNAKPTRKPATGPGSGRGRKPAAATAAAAATATTKEAPKPLSPKKANQVAKSLSSYASSDGEDDELCCGKNQNQIKLVTDSSPKHGSENTTGLSSPVKRINLTRSIDENTGFTLSPAKHGPENTTTTTTGLSSPVRRINFTPNTRVPKSGDENRELGTLPASKKLDFSDSVFMSSPAKRPPPSPFHYTIKETPRKCPLVIKDNHSNPVSQPDFTPRHNSLKSSPRKANLGASFSQTPLKSASTTTPFSARTRLFQSPAKRIPSPFKSSFSSMTRLFESKPVESDGGVGFSSSVTEVKPGGSSSTPVKPERSPPKAELKDELHSAAGDEAKENESHHDVDAESGSESETEGQSEAQVDDEMVELSGGLDTGAEQKIDEDNGYGDMEINADFEGVQRQVGQGEGEGETEDTHVDSMVEDALEEIRERDEEEEEAVLGETNMHLATEDAQPQDDIQEQGEQETGLGDMEEVPMDSEVGDFREAQLEQAEQKAEDETEDTQMDPEIENTRESEAHPEGEVADDDDDVFVDRAVTDMERPSETPARELQEHFEEVPNEQNDDDDVFSDVEEFEYDDDPTLVAPAGNEFYMATPRRASPYEINENKGIMSSLQRVRSNPPPAPSPPTSTGIRPFAFQYHQEAQGNAESDAEEIESEAGVPQNYGREQMHRSESPTPSGRRTPRRGKSMEGQRPSLHEDDNLGFTPLADQLSHWKASSPEKAQSRRPRRRGVFSLTGGLIPGNKKSSSRKSLRNSRVCSDVPRRSLVVTQSLFAELPLLEAMRTESASPVQESGLDQGADLNDKEDDSSHIHHVDDIFCDHESERGDTNENTVQESYTQQADDIFNDPEPEKRESNGNEEIYCDENEPPVLRDDGLTYPVLPTGDEWDQNKENENVTLPDVHKDAPKFPLLSEKDESDENKENVDVPIPLLAPVTPSKSKIYQLQTVHTVSKVPLKPEGQVSPLKMPRKRGRSLSNTSPVRSSPRLRNRVLFPKSPTAPSFSPRKSMRLQESGNKRSPRKSLGLQETVHRAGHRESKDDMQGVQNENTKTLSTVNSPVLRGAVVFVDVHTTEGEDASGIFVELLQQMGARCVKTWSWNPRLSLSPVDGADPKDKDSKVGITHVVYKDGGVRTLEKVRQAAGLVKCVGVGWVLEYVFFFSN